MTTRHEQHSERERLLDAERRARREAEAAQHAAEKAQSALTHLATHDPLTKLPNRLAFERHAARLLSREAATLLFADVDRFKMLNDSLGHTTGDRFLVETASRISQVLRPGDFAARIGGDEFVVILPGEEAAVAQSVASRLLETLRQPLDVDGSRIQTSASIGVASAPAGSTIDVLLRNADIALYRSKDAGRDRVAWFDLAAHDQLMERTALERDLRSALEHELLQQHYQPAFDLATGRMTGAEALARWQHPTRGWIRPDVFIPIAEDSGLMPELGVAALQTAVLRAIRWRHLPDFTVWVNVSARQLDAPGLADRLLALISNARLEPSRIGVEVTESVFADQGVALTELRRLSDRGMPIAIDDFGTGYSSLSRLIELPIDVLKIDRSFIARAGEQQGLAALSMIVNVADSLGLSTIAEGVETAQQLDLMKNLGVSHAQGFLLGRPVPAEQLLTFDGGQGGLLPA